MTNMTNMTNISAVLSEVVRDAEAFRDTDEHVVEVMSPGDIWWQGDCGIQMLNREKPKGLTFLDTKGLQLAEGSGEGSRHVASGDGLQFVQLFHVLAGWLLWAPNGLTVRHPVHGDVVIKEPGLFLVRFPRQLVVGRTGKLVDILVRNRD